MSKTPAVLNLNETDLVKMLGASVHIGTRNLDTSMEQYVWKRRADGVYIIDLRKTWEKLVLAARIIVTIENPDDVALVSVRPHGQRAVLKFAHFTGARSMAGRFTPGMFTNQIQKIFAEPRLLIAQDPRTDHQPLREASYVNVPTIAFCHTDAPLRYVDVAIPSNNKGKLASGLMYWFLTREVLRMRGSMEVARDKPDWVMPDLFIYRDPEQVEAEEAAAAAEQQRQAEYASQQAAAVAVGAGGALVGGYDPQLLGGADVASSFGGAQMVAAGGEFWPQDAQLAGGLAQPAGYIPHGMQAPGGAYWDASVMGAVTEWGASAQQ